MVDGECERVGKEKGIYARAGRVRDGFGPGALLR